MRSCSPATYSCIPVFAEQSFFNRAGAVVMTIPLPVASPAGSLIAASLLHVEVLAHGRSSQLIPSTLFLERRAYVRACAVSPGLWVHSGAPVSPPRLRMWQSIPRSERRRGHRAISAVRWPAKRGQVWLAGWLAGEPIKWVFLLL